MAEENILDAIKGFSTLIEANNDEILQEMEWEEDGRKIEGYRCAHGGNMYLVFAAEGDEYVRIQFQYQVTNDFLAAALTNHDDGEEILGAGKVEDEDIIRIDPEEQSELIESVESNIEDFFEKIGKEEKERFYIEVLQQLKNESVSWELYEGDNRRLNGFQLSTKLFPLESDVSKKEFSDAVQSVISIGIPTRAFIQYSYGLRQYQTGPTIVKQS